MTYSRLLKRTIFSLGALLTVSVTNAAPAAKTAPTTVTVRAEKPDAIYRQNEPVNFIVSVKQGDEAIGSGEIQWEVSKDNYYVIQSGKTPVVNGTATIPATLDEPGFLTCRVSFSNEGKTIKAAAAAGVDPLLIKPSMPAPEDFDAFWNALKEQQAQIPMNVRITEVEPLERYRGKVRTVEFWADALGGPVSGYISYPLDAKPESLPAILFVHGAGVRGSRQDMTEARAAVDGWIAMDINAHGLPNGKSTEYYKNLAQGEMKSYALRGIGDRDTMYFKGMYMRVLRALDVLTSQHEWDGRNLIIMGGSQGGAQALVGGALDPRVSFVAASIPAMVDPTGAEANRISGMRRLSRKDENGAPLPADLEVLRYYDSVNFSARIKAEVFFSLGFLDLICPPTSVYAAYNVIPGKKAVFNDVEMEHKTSAAASRAAYRAIRANIAATNEAAADGKNTAQSTPPQ